MYIRHIIILHQEKANDGILHFKINSGLEAQVSTHVSVGFSVLFSNRLYIYILVPPRERVCVCVCVCVLACVCVRVRVCVRERASEREREKERGRKKEGECRLSLTSNKTHAYNPVPFFYKILFCFDGCS